MRMSLAPFATASDEGINFVTSWQIVREGLSQTLGEFVSDWDYMTRLHLKAELQIDLPAVRSSTHQGASAEFALVVSAGSNTTRMRGPIWCENIPSGEERLLTVDTQLSGWEIGGRLDLVTTLTVIDPDPIDELGASACGSILWRNHHRVALEGDVSQFPTESADLSQPPYSCPQAGWRLEVDTDDLDANAAGAVRLIINHTHPVMKPVLEGLDSPETTLAMHTLRWDVTRQLINLALDSPEFVERYPSFDEDTLGWTLTNVVRTHFPGESLSSLSAMRDSRRADFESMLQNATGMFG